MIKQIAHICIFAQDLAATEKFYCEILGLERGFDFLKNGELYGFYIKLGENTYLEFFNEVGKEGTERPLIHHLCLEVEDLDSAVESLKAKGVEVTNIKKGGDNSYQAWITDPSGVRIELMQYTPESSQFTGNPCIVDW
jgi:lactoylglutathione lyase/glyoxylase I family protein